MRVLDSNLILLSMGWLGARSKVLFRLTAGANSSSMALPAAWIANCEALGINRVLGKIGWSRLCEQLSFPDFHKRVPGWIETGGARLQISFYGACTREDAVASRLPSGAVQLSAV